MLLKLMEATSASDAKLDLNFLIALLGRHFAIRDDYQNLRSNDISDFDSPESTHYGHSIDWKLKLDVTNILC